MVSRLREARMAKNKKWNKVIARIQALEDALAGLLSAKPKRKKAKASAKKAATSKRKAPAKKPAAKPTKAHPEKRAAPRKAKARKKNLRAAMAESAAMLPQPPIPSL